MIQQPERLLWTLRRGRADDVAAMYELDVICFDEPFRFDLASMERFVAREGAIVVLAESRQELTGFIILHQEAGRVAYVVTLNVAPAFRRQGLAQALVYEAERQALEAGSERIRLHVFVDNTPAISFYERMDYLLEDRDDGFYGVGRDAYVYTKRVARR